MLLLSSFIQCVIGNQLEKFDLARLQYHETNLPHMLKMTAEDSQKFW